VSAAPIVVLKMSDSDGKAARVGLGKGIAADISNKG
jgi:hypothetical protein